MKDKISAVILSFYRPDNIILIVGNLEKNELIDEIIIWHSNPGVELSLPLDSKKTRIIKDNNEFGMHTRWHAAVLAKNETIYMQDDDLLVPEMVIKQLYSHWKSNPNILHGCFGRTRSFLNKYVSKDCYDSVDMVITPCVFFHKKYAVGMINKIPDIDKKITEITKKNGEDILFNYYVMSESQQKNIAYNMRDRIENLPSKNAISSKLGHIKNRTLVLRYCLKNIAPKNFAKYNIKQALAYCILIAENNFNRIIGACGEMIKKTSPLLYRILKRHFPNK